MENETQKATNSPSAARGRLPLCCTQAPTHSKHPKCPHQTLCMLSPQQLSDSISSSHSTLPASPLATPLSWHLCTPEKQTSISPALQLLPQPYCFTHPASPRLPWRSMLCFPKQEDRLEALLSRLHHPSSLTAQHPASNGITHHIPLPSHLPVKSCLALQESEEKTSLPLLAHAAGTREQTNYPERGHCCQAETH